MAQNLEDFYPPIQSAGVNTNKAVQFGARVSGAQEPIVNLIAGASAATLTAAQSTSFVFMNCTSGTLITLPAPVAGLVYEVAIGSSLSTGTHKIITNSTSATSIIGSITVAQLGSNTSATFLSSGTTSNVALQFNGTTTGGSMGTFIILTAISTSQWFVSGLANGSGALATPFAQS